MIYSNEEKARLLEGWKRSGKSISAYVREKGIVRWTFTKWLKAERSGKPCFVEVAAATERTAAVYAKHTVHASYAKEILIENGDVKIHVPLGIGADGLRAVMEGLRGVL